MIKYLAQGQEAPAERFENVSILFSDIVSFTKISSAVRPTQVMDMLNDLFLRFDKLCDKHSVYKVETIGDACKFWMILECISFALLFWLNIVLLQNRYGSIWSA